MVGRHDWTKTRVQCATIQTDEKRMNNQELNNAVDDEWRASESEGRG